MKDRLIEAVNALQSAYNKKVPNGYSQSRKASLGDTWFLSVGLIKDIDDCSSRIRDNDIGKGSFHLGYNAKGQFVLERSYHRVSCVKLIEYHAMSLRKVSYRKITANDIESLVMKFNKYLDKYLTYVKELEANNEIYRQNEYKLEYFNFNL